MKKSAIVFGCFLMTLLGYAQQPSENSCLEALIRPDDPEMAAIDRMLVSGYLNHFCFSSDQKVMNAFSYEESYVPQFSTGLIAERMEVLDRDTPFNLVYNPTVQGFIDLYSVRRRELTSKVLGMSELYFPLFEEALARYNIPLEMKYLAVVESALNPSAISSAGAGGLWQFMVSTGKMYGLNVSSYQDERFDPIKSTDAACRFLRSLYDLYGDWQLALAAYNSGPGNVNKAIRRSGGKKDFWEIKPFLPKETQGYVPAFIAVNYVMNYSAEYNLYPKAPFITFYETDTVAVTKRVDLGVLAKTLDMSAADVNFLNATYKLNEIPENGKKHYLILPVSKLGLFLANEDLIYSGSSVRSNEPALVPAPETVAQTETSATGIPKVIWEDTWASHKVKRGESLGGIADKYNVSLAQLKKWNHIRGSVIHPGQKLKIQHRVKKTIYLPADSNAENAQPKGEINTAPVNSEAGSQETAENTPEIKVVAPVKFKYYTIQPGDTLYKIASRHEGVTVTDIKNLNSGLREHKLVVGEKIKLKQIG